jgi:hypothetical protein
MFVSNSGRQSLPPVRPADRLSRRPRSGLHALLLAAAVLLLLTACGNRENGPATAVADQPTPYPAPPQATPTVHSYPGQPTPATVAAYPPPEDGTEQLFLPAVRLDEAATATPTPSPAPTDTPTPTPTPTIDFAAVRAQLQANNQDLAFVKIGFHVSPGGNPTGLGDWMRRLDAAGVPFFLKSADYAGPILEAQQIAQASDVPHVLVYRRSGDAYDVPNYDLPPAQAARQHWRLHMEAFPPELDPGVVWLETINEVDKERAGWWGQFAVETARLALASGFRWAAFGWSSGEPDAADWQLPSMVEFLRLAAAHPDQLAIALHEYSYVLNEIGHDYPFKVGRFQELFAICDQLGIPRPTVLITEWGWTYQEVPPPSAALEDIEWAASLYAPYPEIKGAAIWHLGEGFGDIARLAQPLIRPLTEFALGNYFAVPLPPARAPINPELYPPPPPRR